MKVDNIVRKGKKVIIVLLDIRPRWKVSNSNGAPAESSDPACHSLGINDFCPQAKRKDYEKSVRSVVTVNSLSFRPSVESKYKANRTNVF